MLGGSSSRSPGSRTQKRRKPSVGGRDGCCKWILGPRPLIKVCVTMAAGHPSDSSPGDGVGGGNGSNSPLRQEGEGKGKVLAPWKPSAQCRAGTRTPGAPVIPLLPRSPRGGRDGLTCPRSPAGASGLLPGGSLSCPVGNRSRAGTGEGRGWEGAHVCGLRTHRGGLWPALRLGIRPSHVTLQSLPPHTQSGKFHPRHITLWPLPPTHQEGRPRAPSPRPRALSRTSRVQWPQTCTSSQTGCSVGEGGGDQR